MKPTCTVDLDQDGLGALPGADGLTALAALSDFKPQRQRALAIYNRSVSRICDKVRRAAAKLEAAFAEEIAVGWGKIGIRGDAEIIDAIELVIYAAAEHTDDLKAIARELAGSNGENPKRASDRMERLLSPIRRRVSLMTNKIKHEQWRISICRQQFTHGKETTILYGLSLLSLSHDRVGLEVLPPDGARVIALPSLLWSVIELLYRTSEELLRFLGVAAHNAPAVPAPQFAAAVVAIGRLPNYSFEDEHAFHRVRLRIYADDEANRRKLESTLYGAFGTRWNLSAPGEPGNFSFGVQGDGVTRSFDFPTLKSVTLQHWT